MAVRVLIADDSAVARTLLCAVVQSAPELELAGQAVNGEEAVELSEQLKPDVVVMDVNMPKLDGIAATRAIMRRSPRPVMIVSSIDARDAKLAFEALSAGAIAVHSKPPAPTSPEFEKASERFAASIVSLASVRTRRSGAGAPAPIAEHAFRTVELVAIGASTGGPAALGEILRALPADTGAPIVIAQHIIDGFESGLATWLDTLTPLHVGVATDGARPQPGQVLIAPTGSHLTVGSDLTLSVREGPPIARHRPSVTRMFESVADLGPRALSVILTGMGDDGVAGLRVVHAAGGTVIAQDGPTCIVHGMPREAVLAGVVDHELPLGAIAAAIRAAAGRANPLTTQATTRIGH